MSEVFHTLVERQVTVIDKLWHVKCRTCHFVFDLPEWQNLERRENLTEAKLAKDYTVTCPNCTDSWQVIVDYPTVTTRGYQYTCPCCASEITQRHTVCFFDCQNCGGSWPVK